MATKTAPTNKPGRKKAAPKDPNAPAETKEQRFTRLAVPRTKKVLKGLSQLANLGAANYASTPEQIAKIKEAVTTAVDNAFDKLEKREIKSSSFTL